MSNLEIASNPPDTSATSSVALKDATPRILSAACGQFYTWLVVFSSLQAGLVWVVQTWVRPCLSPQVDLYILYVVVAAWAFFAVLNYFTYSRNWRTKATWLRVLVVNLLLAMVLYFAAFFVPVLLVQRALLYFASLTTVAALYCWLVYRCKGGISFITINLLTLVGFAVLIYAHFYLSNDELPMMKDIGSWSTPTVRSLLLLGGVGFLVGYAHWRLLSEIKDGHLNQYEVSAVACSVLAIVVVAAVMEIYSVTYMVVFRSKVKMMATFICLATFILCYKFGLV
jgi:hypothetical protein